MTLIRPRFLSKLGNFYPGRVTVQRATIARDSYGGEVQTWSDLPGHVGLAASISPSVFGTPTGANVVKRDDKTLTDVSHHIALPGYFPDIKATMRVLEDDEAYEILAVEHDSHRITTRLRVRRLD